MAKKYSLGAFENFEGFRVLKNKLKQNKGNIVLVEKKITTTENYGRPGVHYFISPVHHDTHHTLEAGLVRHPYIEGWGFIDEYGIGFGTHSISAIKLAVNNKLESGYHSLDKEWHLPFKKENNSLLLPIEGLTRKEKRLPGIREALMGHPTNEFGPLSGIYVDHADVRIGDNEINAWFDEQPLKANDREGSYKKYFDALKENLYDWLKNGKYDKIMSGKLEKEKNDVLEALIKLDEQTKIFGAEKTKYEAEKLLNQAIEIKMHKTRWKYTPCSRPGEKIAIDVPKFVRGLCEKYKVEIR